MKVKVKGKGILEGFGVSCYCIEQFCWYQAEHWKSCTSVSVISDCRLSFWWFMSKFKGQWQRYKRMRFLSWALSTIQLQLHSYSSRCKIRPVMHCDLWLKCWTSVICTCTCDTNATSRNSTVLCQQMIKVAARNATSSGELLPVILSFISHKDPWSLEPETLAHLKLLWTESTINWLSEWRKAN